MRTVPNGSILKFFYKLVKGVKPYYRYTADCGGKLKSSNRCTAADRGIIRIGMMANYELG